MIKNFIRITALQVILTLFVGILPMMDASHYIIALMLGSLFSFFNFIGLSGFFILALYKKRVALGISVVVIKYAFLGILLWYVLAQTGQPKGPFVTGLIINPVSLIVFALIFSKKLTQTTDQNENGRE